MQQQIKTEELPQNVVDLLIELYARQLEKAVFEVSESECLLPSSSGEPNDL